MNVSKMINLELLNKHLYDQKLVVEKHTVWQLNLKPYNNNYHSKTVLGYNIRPYIYIYDLFKLLLFWTETNSLISRKAFLGHETSTT